MAETKIAVRGIYVARNIVSGRMYVGSSIDIHFRWRKHIECLRRGDHHSSTFQRSWNKHGEAVFVWEVLELVDSDELLTEREQYWIDLLGAHDHIAGLNRNPTAGSSFGRRMSDAAKAKVSAANKGRVKTQEECEAISLALSGKPKSEEHKASLSAANLGKKATEETRAALRAAHAASGKAAAFLTKFWAEMTPEAHSALRAKAAATKAGMPQYHLRSMTFETAQEVRSAKAEGLTYDKLVERFGIDRATLWKVVNMKTYLVP